MTEAEIQDMEGIEEIEVSCFIFTANYLLTYADELQNKETHKDMVKSMVLNGMVRMLDIF